ncbi:MAG: SAM-dependent methyltransferase [Proteobacteria bacterium]|nr:SAM-dependent methyltransferase [Pseudomonadota bacterium]NBP16759.1 SAM-dependent methyltransferase [bacterium]
MDYSTRFNNQTHNFLDAVQSYKNALDEEMMTAIKMLDLQQNEILLNAFAGGIPLDKYIDTRLGIEYLEYDTNKDFCNNTIVHYTIDNIPIRSQSVDKIICLATLHHFNDRERDLLYKEFHRVLKPSGMLVIADVIENSPQANWLNVFVNKYNSNGHKGVFFSPKDSQLIKNTGFNNVTVFVQHYNWWFPDDDNLVRFFKLLFGLNLCELDLLLDNIKQFLEYTTLNDVVVVPWKLMYFNCKKT